MEIVISLLALLIAVAEFWMLILEHRKINREKKEQEEKERLIATFAEQTSKINDFTETFFRQSISFSIIEKKNVRTRLQNLTEYYRNT